MSIHCNAEKEDIKKIVLMPGDPLRAKYIAENFLEICLHTQEHIREKNLLFFLLVWVCLAWEFIAMSYINFMMLMQ